MKQKIDSILTLNTRTPSQNPGSTPDFDLLRKTVLLEINVFKLFIGLLFLVVKYRNLARPWKWFSISCNISLQIFGAIGLSNSGREAIVKQVEKAA